MEQTCLDFPSLISVQKIIFRGFKYIKVTGCIIYKMHGLTDSAWGWIIVENLAVAKPAKEFLHILCIPTFHYHVHKLFTTSCPVPR